ncbi:MAG: hypothetical protein MJ099_05085 [Clostridia bacterium]|nr:hypothetical protein [Clostridia bacterium]
MRKCTILLLLLALLLPTVAIGEGELATDLAGITPDLAGGELALQEALVQEPVNIRAAELLVGYVAPAGAAVNPIRCNERDLVSMNEQLET